MPRTIQNAEEKARGWFRRARLLNQCGDDAGPGKDHRTEAQGQTMFQPRFHFLYITLQRGFQFFVIAPGVGFQRFNRDFQLFDIVLGDGFQFFDITSGGGFRLFDRAKS